MVKMSILVKLETITNETFIPMWKTGFLEFVVHMSNIDARSVESLSKLFETNRPIVTH